MSYKRILSLIISIVACTGSYSQTSLTLEACYQMAIENYPLIKQKSLIEKSTAYTVDNLSKSIWPQIMVNGQASYQSEVASIQIPIAGFNFNPPSKDQYKIFADINQPITELFTTQQQKNLAAQNAQISKQQIDVELYKIKDRINQLFFGILLTNEQLQINQLVDADLVSGKNRINAAIKNGVDYKSSLDKINAEIIKNQQREIELMANKKAFTDMLGYFIQQNEINTYTLVKPLSVEKFGEIKRPEINYFDTKQHIFSTQARIIKNKNIPRFSLFLQTGVGKPSPLNFISNSFKPYAIGGVKASWNITNWYVQKNELSQIKIDQQNNELQKELFIFNTQFNGQQQSSDIVKLKNLIEKDASLLELRHAVTNASKIQLENGVITTNDYIKEINAEDQARQQKLLHEIQLLMAQYNLQFTLGN